MISEVGQRIAQTAGFSRVRGTVMKAPTDKGFNVVKQVNLLGFSTASVGGHSARSMMYREMSILIHTMPVAVAPRDFYQAIVDENVLEKATQGSRKKSLHHLIELYGLDSSKPLFRVLRNCVTALSWFEPSVLVRFLKGSQWKVISNKVFPDALAQR
jgi:hypothetical protein